VHQKHNGKNNFTFQASASGNYPRKRPNKENKHTPISVGLASLKRQLTSEVENPFTYLVFFGFIFFT